LLNPFVASAGIRVNYAKSIMAAINIPKDKMIILASTFCCVIGTLPFTCLVTNLLSQGLFVKMF
jgi:hypothetical protein